MVSTHIIGTPVFSGKTERGERIVLYKDRASMIDRFYIKRPDGEIRLLTDGGELDWYIDPIHHTHHLKITSIEWTGTAKGTWEDVIEEESLRG